MSVQKSFTEDICAPTNSGDTSSPTADMPIKPIPPTEVLVLNMVLILHGICVATIVLGNPQLVAKRGSSAMMHVDHSTKRVVQR